MDYGLVSIIMPNYNSEKYLKDTIESVLAQTYTNWELLFVDDCSNDASLQIVREFSDSRIKIFQNETNSGAAASRNCALNNSKGDWIAFLDSDDLWLPEKLEKQLDFMVKENCAFSFTNYFVKEENTSNQLLYAPKKDEYSYKDILKHCYIGCLTVIYNRKALGLFTMPEAAIKREDWACWLQILKTGIKAKCLHEALAIYLVRSGSVSSSKRKMIKWQWNVYRKVEKIAFFKSFYYLMHWAIKGFFKYK